MKIYNKDFNEESYDSRSVCSCNNPATSTCNSKCADGVKQSDKTLKEIYKKAL